MYNLALARYPPDMLWRAELEFRNERDLLQEPTEREPNGPANMVRCLQDLTPSRHMSEGPLKLCLRLYRPKKELLDSIIGRRQWSSG